MKNFISWVTVTLRKAFVAILGQGLAFVALLCPVIFGNHAVLPEIVFFSSVATLFSPIVTLGVPQMVPTLDNPKEKLKLAWQALALMFFFGLIIFFIAIFIDAAKSFNFLALILLLFGQGCYSTQVAFAVRYEHYKAVARARLVLGITSLAGALFAAAISGSASAYLIAGAFAQLAAAFSFGMPKLVWETRDYSLRAFKTNANRHLGQNFKLFLTVIVSTAVSQVPGFISATFVEGRTLFALAIRVSSGFETMAGNVLGPLFDGFIASNVRANLASDLRSSIKKTKKFSLLLMSLAALLYVGIVLGFSLISFESDIQRATFLAGIGLILSSTYFASIGRVFYLVRRVSVKLMVEMSRGLMLAATLLVPFAGARVCAAGVIFLLSLGAVEYALRWSLRSYSPTP